MTDAERSRGILLEQLECYQLAKDRKRKEAAKSRIDSAEWNMAWYAERYLSTDCLPIRLDILGGLMGEW